MSDVKGMLFMAEQISKRTNGQLIVEHVGGPEAVPGFDQPEAVRKGVVDMAITPTNYYEGIVPIGTMVNLSVLTADEEEKVGARAFWNELAAPAGLYHIWRAAGSWSKNSFTIVSRKKVEKSSDLAKIKLGATAAFLRPYMVSIGSNVIIITQPEAYTALERGVVDAFCWPIQNSITLAIYEVTKYIVEPSFFAGSSFFLMNLEKWNSLSKNHQDVLREVARESHASIQVDWKATVENAYKKYRDAGGEVITLSDADEFSKAVYNATWADLIKKYPNVAPKVRGMVNP